MWDIDKYRSRNFWLSVQPFSLPLLIAPLFLLGNGSPLLCAFEDSVKFSAPPTPTQVWSFNLGLINHRTSPPTSRMIGPKDKHMIQAGPKYFPGLQIYWRGEKEVFLSLSLLNEDKVNLELPQYQVILLGVAMKSTQERSKD